MKNLQGVCKECGAGTLNNNLNPAFEMEDDGEGDGEQATCKFCHSRHVDVLPMSDSSSVANESAPAAPKRIKRITSHVGLSRYYATVADTNHHIDRVTSIPSPYASGPDHIVYRDSQERLVFVVETAHKTYDVFQVPSGTKLFEYLPDDSKQYDIEVR